MFDLGPKLDNFKDALNDFSQKGLNAEQFRKNS